jgi:hypothetical protein
MHSNTGIRIPNSESYWKNKGKIGKKVAIYTHDDADGIFSAIAIKGYLVKKGFEIVSYGLVNYQDGWNLTKLDNSVINVATDYSENIPGIDIYIDHHGVFEHGDYRKNGVKTNTGSAYEGIMQQLGLPVDDMILNVIDMIDSAKYDEYNVDIKKILDFDLKEIKNKLEFAASFNQLLKRSDHKTFIEVIANIKDITPSIYNIYLLFKLFYPGNNYDFKSLQEVAKNNGFINDDGWSADIDKTIDFIKTTDPKSLINYRKDFLEDAFERLEKMAEKTRGLKHPRNGMKIYIDSQNKFKQLFKQNNKVEMDGYQIIGNLAFFPTGIWANALRARAIISQDLLHDERISPVKYKISKNSPIYLELNKKDGQQLELVGDIKDNIMCAKYDVTNNNKIKGISGIIDINDNITFITKRPIMWTMLQYGNTLQISTLNQLNSYVRDYLPVLKDNTIVDNLGTYTDNLVYNMAKYFGFNVLLVQDCNTRSGGHPGIGNISNIFGTVNPNIKSVPDPRNVENNIILDDIAKKLMQDYSGVKFLDLFKNKIIDDLSGICFKDLKMTWNDIDEVKKNKPREHEINKKVMFIPDIRKEDDVRKESVKKSLWDEWNNIII